MFISRQAHEQIVALLNVQLADKDRQIVELKADRDFYRSAWTAKQGERFPAADATRPFPLSRSDEVPVRIDAYWSPDDRDIFLTWASGRFPAGMNELEILDQWKGDYGDSTPSMIAGSFAWREV